MDQLSRMEKYATAIIEMGDPAVAGKGLADIIRFITSRIDPKNQQKSLEKLRKKIWYLNENEIANKKTPPSASLGQSITFVKTVLIGHDPSYIRAVLKQIYIDLGGNA